MYRHLHVGVSAHHRDRGPSGSKCSAGRWFVALLMLGALGCSRPRAPRTLAVTVDVSQSAGESYDFDEEFVGPMASWKSVQDFGAVGDGLADDTDAIQRALDALKQVATNDWCVLYFPAGTYRITKTLVTRRAGHLEYLGGSIVGEHPTTTVLRWDGPAEQDMFHYDAWYTKVSRLTFDGAGRARIGLYRGDSFSTHCELSDLVFRDMQIGVQLGGGLSAGTSAGQAEHAILRCRFYRCSKYGVHTADWNSLDIWVWYCWFEECGHALFNSTGNFHAIRNVFLRSKDGDIGSANLSQFAIIGNTSVGSRTFTNWGSYHTNGAQVLILGNRIFDPSMSSVLTGSAGPFVILDNVIRDRSGFGGPSIWLDANDQFVMGNSSTFAAAKGVQQALNSWRGRERVTILDTRSTSRSSMELPDLTLPPTPPIRRRRVFEVGPGDVDRTALIQANLDAAAHEPPGSRPVVHLGKGVFKISQSIVIPSGSDVVLLGDGGAETETKLLWTGAGTGPVLRLEGPSRATLRDLSIYAQDADGVVVTRADQPGGRVYANQLDVRGGATPERAARYGVRIDGVENADVTLACSNFSGAATNVSVRGGSRRSHSLDAAGQVSVLTGASSNAGVLYDVTDGGELLAVAVWYEGDWKPTTRIDLHSSGTLTLASMQFATAATREQPLIRVREHRGRFALVASNMTGAVAVPAHRVELTGAAETEVLSLGNSSFVSGSQPVDPGSIWVDKMQAPALSGMFHNHQYGQFVNPEGSAPKSFAFTENLCREPAEPRQADFIRRALRPLREARIEPPHRRAAGSSSVQLHRVQISVGKGRTGLEVRR